MSRRPTRATGGLLGPTKKQEPTRTAKPATAKEWPRSPAEQARRRKAVIEERERQLAREGSSLLPQTVGRTIRRRQVEETVLPGDVSAPTAAERRAARKRQRAAEQDEAIPEPTSAPLPDVWDQPQERGSHQVRTRDAVLAILRSPDGVRHGLMIREILAPPVSQRPRR